MGAVRAQRTGVADGRGAAARRRVHPAGDPSGRRRTVAGDHPYRFRPPCRRGRRRPRGAARRTARGRGRRAGAGCGVRDRVRARGRDGLRLPRPGIPVAGDGRRPARHLPGVRRVDRGLRGRARPARRLVAHRRAARGGRRAHARPRRRGAAGAVRGDRLPGPAVGVAGHPSRRGHRALAGRDRRGSRRRRPHIGRRRPHRRAARPGDHKNRRAGWNDVGAAARRHRRGRPG